MNEGVLPTILGLEKPLESEGLLDFVAKENRKGDYKYFIKHSFGVGGSNTALVFKKFTQ